MPFQEPKKSLEAIVSEVGKYPIDAYVFVQECVGLAAEQVHGNLSSEQAVVAKWMADEDVTPEELRRLEHEGALPPTVAAALMAVGGAARMNRHVTGQDLCVAVRDAALKRWGMMARSVLTRWKLQRTEDIGAIVFALVDNGWLQKQPTDSLEDFSSVFSFDEAFEEAYQIGTT